LAALIIQANPIKRQLWRLFALAAMTLAAVLVHGYHLGVDDAAIYAPAVKRAADPTLYPYASEFFMSHARLSFFGEIAGYPARLTGIPVDWVILLWHVASIFLLLLACFRVARACFVNESAQWAAAALVAGLLAVPVAGTALSLMDPYLTARSFSTPAIMFAIADAVSGRPKRAAAWLAFTALVHVQMSAYGLVFIASVAACAAMARDRAPAVKKRAVGMAGLVGLPFVFDFEPARGAAREALYSRTYFFLSRWEWYEWIGVFAPLAMLWWFSSVKRKGTTPVFRSLSRALVLFGGLFTVFGIVLASSARLENYTRLQPMRSFHLLYVVFFVLLGGLIGEYALKRSVWRWFALFLPMAIGMWLAGRDAYASSPHIEWPGASGGNRWVAAFQWVRQNTPKDAVFALDPNFMKKPGEDLHGFRAIAERSALADNIKDSGAVSLFPQLADTWKAHVLAQSGWDKFQAADFERLAKRYPVTWVITRAPGPAGLVCPYRNRELAVCRLQPAEAAVRPH
jgi:hypothetical protein